MLEAKEDQETRFGKLERKQRTNKFFKVEKCAVERRGWRKKNTHGQIFSDDVTNDFSYTTCCVLLCSLCLKVTACVSFFTFEFRKFWGHELTLAKKRD